MKGEDSDESESDVITDDSEIDPFDLGIDMGDEE